MGLSRAVPACLPRAKARAWHPSAPVPGTAMELGGQQEIGERGQPGGRKGRWGPRLWGEQQGPGLGAGKWIPSLEN